MTQTRMAGLAVALMAVALFGVSACTDTSSGSPLPTTPGLSGQPNNSSIAPTSRAWGRRGQRVFRGARGDRFVASGRGCGWGSGAGLPVGQSVREVDRAVVAGCGWLSWCVGVRAVEMGWRDHVAE